MELNEELGKITCKAQIDHPYPTTKIMFMPETVRAVAHADLFCSRGVA